MYMESKIYTFLNTIKYTQKIGNMKHVTCNIGRCDSISYYHTKIAADIVAVYQVELFSRKARLII